MNLNKLFEIQKELDTKIVKEHNLQDQDLLPKKILALQVELGELANEWRGFKFWSKDQEPRTAILKKCRKCHGTGLNLATKLNEKIPACDLCYGSGELEANPLLEEYVDCLHFILSIGLELGSTDVDVTCDYTEETATKTFISIYGDIDSIINNLETDILNKFVKEDYRTLVNRFVGLGEKYLGFTWEQIQQAYLDKNKVNHERQENGY